MVFREVNEQNWTPEASAFFRSKTAGNTRQNRRKPSQKSVDVSGVQNRSFTSRKSIHLRFQHPQKMRAPSAPSFTKFNSAHLTRTAESSQNPGAPAERVLAQNEFRTQRRPLNVAFVLRRTVRNFEEVPALPGLPGSRLRERRSQQLVEELRVALAAARFHALAYQKADDLLVAVTILLRLIGTVCQHLVHDRL